jgi:hypothetical protein
MRCVFNAIIATAVGVLSLASAPAATEAADVRVSGGGTATFDDFEGGTVFSVEASIDEDGNVRGHFFCQIAGVVVINGDDLVEATVNDDGSVTLYGFAHGWFAPVGVFEGLPFAVQLWSGGPGVGRFIYDDPVVGPSGGVDLSEGDHETLARGHIMIREN